MDKKNNKNKKQTVFYKKRLANDLMSDGKFLIENLRKEWEMLERGARKEQLVREVKEMASVSVETVLKLLAIGGICTAVLVAPKVFTLVAEAQKYKKYLSKEKAKDKFRYLKRLKYIDLESIGDNKYRVKITNKGLARAMEGAFRLGEIYKNQKWDGKWRVVIFDIPEKHKSAREGFRIKLADMGFRRMQDSSFISPYPCEKEIIFLSNMYCISSYIHFMESEYLFDDEEFRKFFRLL